MRKLIVLLILVIAIGGGYSAYWHKKAGDFQAMLEQSIASLNDQAKTISPTPLVRYEAIRAVGFPFDMTLEIVKPVVDLPVSTILRKFPPQGVTLPAATPFTWVEEISYGESVTLSGNIWGNRFTVTANGDRTHKTLVNNVQRHALIGSSSSPAVCHLAVEQPKGAAPWTMQPIFTDPQTFLSIFRDLDCDVSGIAMKDAVSGAALGSADRAYFKASNEDGSGANRKMALEAKEDNAKVLPAFDSVFNDYRVMTYTILGKSTRDMAPMPFSQYGAQSLNADIRYDGPTQAKDLLDPAMQLHFDINALELKSALADSNIEVHVATVPQGNSRTATIVVHTPGEFSEQYNQLLLANITESIAEMQKNPPQSGPEVMMAQALAHMGTPQEIATVVTPNLHRQGKISLDIDADAKGDNNWNMLFQRGAYTLNKFDWTSSLYGITSKGSANLSIPGKLPSGDLVLTCLSCDALIADAGDYASRIEALIIRSQPTHQPVVTHDFVESVRQFLHGIAQNGSDRSAKDLVIHIVMKDTGEFTVSGKQVMQVMSLFGSTIGAHLPLPQPPTGVTPGLAPPR